MPLRGDRKKHLLHSTNQQITPKQAKSWTVVRDNLSEGQLQRLWEHHLHADDILYSRLNIFLVFETVLLTAISVVYSKPSPDKLILTTIICLSLALTLFSAYAQAKQKYVLDRLKARLREVLPEYQAIRENREPAQKWLFSISSVTLLTYGIPPLMLCVWIVLLVRLMFT